MREAACTRAAWRCPTAQLVAAGALALALGALVYLADRNPTHAALIPTVPALAGLRLFGTAGAWLPSLVHPFAFSLFTAALAPPGARPAYWACAMWWAVNIAFEIAQAPGVNADVAEALSQLLGQTWLANALSNYLLRGTCDVADLVAATAGAVAAGAVLRFIHLRQTRHAR